MHAFIPYMSLTIHVCFGCIIFNKNCRGPIPARFLPGFMYGSFWFLRYAIWNCRHILTLDVSESIPRISRQSIKISENTQIRCPLLKCDQIRRILDDWATIFKNQFYFLGYFLRNSIFIFFDEEPLKPPLINEVANLLCRIYFLSLKIDDVVILAAL